MAKKQTRRSISVSRMTYERLKAFCEANNISMSQLVETRVNDFLGEGSETVTDIRPTQMPSRPTMPAPVRPQPGPVKPISDAAATTAAPTARPSSPAIPMTSAAARFAVDPPPPIIKPKQETAAPKPAEKTANQIFSAGFGAAVSCLGLMIGGGGSTANRAAADVIGIAGVDGRIVAWWDAAASVLGFAGA